MEASGALLFFLSEEGFPSFQWIYVREFPEPYIHRRARQVNRKKCAWIDWCDVGPHAQVSLWHGNVDLHAAIHLLQLRRSNHQPRVTGRGDISLRGFHSFLPLNMSQRV